VKRAARHDTGILPYGSMLDQPVEVRAQATRMRSNANIDPVGLSAPRLSQCRLHGRIKRAEK
jgi:hypothetical protein